MKKTSSNSDRILKIASQLWVFIVALSQLLFIFYICKFYAGNALNNSPEAWNDMTIKGYVSGDFMGNFVFATHMILAVMLMLSGLLQLVPWIRAHAIKFHKINGRIYIFSSVLISLGGIYLVWVREAIINLNGAVAITLNAILIIAFSFVTIKTARSKQIESHRKWALRTFMVVNGVWFFRVGFMAWILIHQDAKWSTENLDGPFDLVWAYANYLLPLAILELYFYLKEKKKNYLLSGILFLSIILIGIGTIGSYLIMWKPNM